MTGTGTVWRGRVEPGAVVSWRHPNPAVNRREGGTVVDVGPDTLTVDVVDHAGTYRVRLTAADMPGLTVDVRPYPNGPDACWCGSGRRGEHANGVTGHYV